MKVVAKHEHGYNLVFQALFLMLEIKADAFNSARNCLSLDSARRSNNCAVSLRGQHGCVFLRESFSEFEFPFRCIIDMERIAESNCGIRVQVYNTSLGFRDENGTCAGSFLHVESCVPEEGSRFCGDVSDQTYEFPFQRNASAFRLIADFTTSSRNTQVHINYELLSDCEMKNVLFWGPEASNFPEVNGTMVASIPCYVRIDERRGTINSPWFPDLYPENMDCIYEFHKIENSFCGIRLKTQTFELEDPTTTTVGLACADFFQTPGCGFVCGVINFTWVVKYQPGASSVILHFHSDEEHSKGGFQIEFEQIHCST